VLNLVWVSDLGVSVILATQAAMSGTPSLVSYALIKPGLLEYPTTSCSARTTEAGESLVSAHLDGALNLTMASRRVVPYTKPLKGRVR
jgi:hypothetical protein